jgi:pimeloyl-ACP methyl ester carboxylesterase
METLKLLTKFIFLILFVYLLVVLFFYLFQRKLLYHPTKAKNLKVKRKSFLIDNVKVETVFLDRDAKRAIIYFGGNAEAVENSAKDFENVLKDWDIYFLEYRGYGKSKRSPSETKIFKDALFIYDSLKSKYKEIALIGRSLGTGVALFLASKREVDRLVLVTPFDSVEAVAKERFPFLPVSLILKDKFDSLSKAKNITSKTLIILAQDDKVIPKKHSLKLIDALKNSKKLKIIVIQNGTHNNLQYFKEYFKEIEDFLK